MPLYNIAGLTVEMSAKHALTASRAERYRVDAGEPVFSLIGEGEAAEEYASLARVFYEHLLRFDGFLLHASAVALDGKAYAFFAPSGTGKSTHTSFWRRTLGAAVINDDKPAVRLIDDVFCACGTPFSGKADLSANVCVPLGALVYLRRAETTSVRRLSTAQALHAILSQTLRPNRAQEYDRLLTLLERLLLQVPVYEASVPNHPDAALEVKQAMERL